MRSSRSLCAFLPHTRGRHKDQDPLRLRRHQHRHDSSPRHTGAKLLLGKDNSNGGNNPVQRYTTRSTSTTRKSRLQSLDPTNHASEQGRDPRLHVSTTRYRRRRSRYYIIPRRRPISSRKRYDSQSFHTGLSLRPLLPQAHTRNLQPRGNAHSPPRRHRFGQECEEMGPHSRISGTTGKPTYHDVD